MAYLTPDQRRHYSHACWASAAVFVACLTAVGWVNGEEARDAYGLGPGFYIAARTGGAATAVLAFLHGFLCLTNLDGRPGP